MSKVIILWVLMGNVFGYAQYKAYAKFSDMVLCAQVSESMNAKGMITFCALEGSFTPKK